MAGPRKVPQRTCLGCRSVRPKKELIRIVRTPEGSVVVDPTGKRSGRGAYLCPSPDCLERARKGKTLEKALEQEIIGEEVWNNLARQLKLPAKEQAGDLERDG
ncbi:MAG: YlxR family protein [Bacillota bacterium]|nr:YlxR family protein [Bacillota bacterium]